MIYHGRRTPQDAIALTTQRVATVNNAHHSITIERGYLALIRKQTSVNVREPIILCMCVCVRTRAYVRARVHTCAHARASVCVHVHACMCVYMCVRVCVCAATGCVPGLLLGLSEFVEFCVNKSCLFYSETSRLLPSSSGDAQHTYMYMCSCWLRISPHTHTCTHSHIHAHTHAPPHAHTPTRPRLYSIFVYVCSLYNTFQCVNAINMRSAASIRLDVALQSATVCITRVETTARRVLTAITGMHHFRPPIRQAVSRVGAIRRTPCLGISPAMALGNVAA